jgi:hypothetical protein
MADHIFISYSTKDLAGAEAVCAGLEDSGLTCWYGSRDMQPGQAFAETIVEALRGCAAVVVVFSRHADTSRQVIREVELAASLGKPVVTFRVTSDSPSGSLEYHLGSSLWIDGSSRPSATDVTALAQTLREILPAQTHSNHQPHPPTPSGAPGEPDGRDVFISYRREDGAQIARLLRAELRARGYRVFLDVDDLKPGHFDDALLQEIDSAPSFLLILTPNSLARCADERDWMRREIAHALETGKKIIPVTMQGFEFPDAAQLPEDIRTLTVHHAISYSHEFFDAMVEKLIGFLDADPKRRRPG